MAIGLQICRSVVALQWNEFFLILFVRFSVWLLPWTIERLFGLVKSRFVNVRLFLLLSPSLTLVAAADTYRNDVPSWWLGDTRVEYDGILIIGFLLLASFR